MQATAGPRRRGCGGVGVRGWTCRSSIDDADGLLEGSRVENRELGVGLRIRGCVRVARSRETNAGEAREKARSLTSPMARTQYSVLSAPIFRAGYASSRRQKHQYRMRLEEET